MREKMCCSLNPALQASILDEAALGMVSSLVGCKVSRQHHKVLLLQCMHCACPLVCLPAAEVCDGFMRHARSMLIWLALDLFIF